jgi:hypothetical protein
LSPQPFVVGYFANENFVHIFTLAGSESRLTRLELPHRHGNLDSGSGVGAEFLFCARGLPGSNTHAAEWRYASRSTWVRGEMNLTVGLDMKPLARTGGFAFERLCISAGRSANPPGTQRRNFFAHIFLGGHRNAKTRAIARERKRNLAYVH